MLRTGTQLLLEGLVEKRAANLAPLPSSKLAGKTASSEADRLRLNANAKRWRERNPVKAAAAQRRWRDRNRANYNAARKVWRDKNREKVRKQSNARVAKWVALNPEKARQSQKQRNKTYLHKHREKVRLGLRTRYRQNHAFWRDYHKKWRANNPESRKRSMERRRQKYNTDPVYRLKCLAHCRLRQARKLGNGVGETKTFMETTAAVNEHICFYCLNPVLLKNIHIDHFMPLCLGGIHDSSNLVVSCAHCNEWKQGRHPYDFYVELDQFNNGTLSSTT